MIVFDHVAYGPSERTILEDVSFMVAPGDACCILGKNGSGKTTILHLLLRMLRPTRGRITVDRADLAAFPAAILRSYRQSIGTLAEEDGIRPSTTPASAVGEALRLHGVPRMERGKRGAALLARLGLEAKADAALPALNRLERRKLALARALAAAPGILLLDEPTMGLDAAGTREITALVRALHREGKTMIVTTVSPSFARELGFRTLTLEHGRIAAAGTSPGEASEKPRAATPPRTRITPTVV